MLYLCEPFKNLMTAMDFLSEKVYMNKVYVLFYGAFIEIIFRFRALSLFSSKHLVTLHPLYSRLHSDLRLSIGNAYASALDFPSLTCLQHTTSCVLIGLLVVPCIDVHENIHNFADNVLSLLCLLESSSLFKT